MRYTDNFTVEEMDCPCGSCGLKKMDGDFMQRLQHLRTVYGKPLKINSGMRCPDHNREVGGSPTSSHLYGLASDISVTDSSMRHTLLNIIIRDGTFNRIGIAKTFIHVDSDRTKAQNKVWVY